MNTRTEFPKLQNIPESGNIGLALPVDFCNFVVWLPRKDYFHGKEIEIGGVRLHYDESGPAGGRPVLLMHGWGCDHSTVASIAGILSAGMHIYNVDLPGHGKATSLRRCGGVDSFTRLMEEFTERLGLKDPVLIGHSFGGRIAILMSSRNPVSKVVLVDAAK